MRTLILVLALAATPAAAQEAQPVAGPAAPARAPVIITPGKPGSTTIGARPALPGATPPKPVGGPGAPSRNAPVNGVLVLYGNERCPTDNDGNEVVVCSRRSAAEQFRVPKELREFQVTPQNESWAARVQGVAGTEVGANAIGSCSVVGAGGQTGCFAQAARANRRENKARAAETANDERLVSKQ
jgi:hypothetical protein